MIDAIILYGSKARNDSARNSDTDLLRISNTGRIEKSYDSHGVSFHVYPLTWILEQAQNGSLFILHLVSEAVPLHDPGDILKIVKEQFLYKESYGKEIEISFRILSVVENLQADKFSNRVRSRFFWGLRTGIIALAANNRKPVFSARALESFSGIIGLADCINHRNSISFNDCKRIGCLASDFINKSGFTNHLLRGLTDLDALFDIGGLAAATAAEITYGL